MINTKPIDQIEPTADQVEPNWQKHYEPGLLRHIDIPDIPLYRIFDDAAARTPDATALRFVLKKLNFGISIESSMTYHEVMQATDRFATALYEMGIRKGDRVGIMMPNMPEQIIAYYGILKAGGIVVNINPTYTPRELTHQLADCGAETIVTLTGLYERVAKIQDDTSIRHIVLADLTDSLAWHWRLLAARQVRKSGMMADVPSAPGIYSFGQLLHYPADPPTIDFDGDDVALLQYTGGTTGMPKAAMLTHRNVVSNTYQACEWLKNFTENEKVLLGALPFFHVYGMTVCMLTAFNINAELVVTPDPRQTDLLLKIIEQNRITIYPGVPAMYNSINNHPDVANYNLKSIEACFSGGASLPISVTKSFESITGGALAEGYGLTECSPIALGNPLRGGKRRIGSIGIPMPNTSAELIALEPDEEGNFPLVEQGERGELVVYGPQVMKGYWNNPEETAKTINERGGLRTGDIARMDEDGFFYIVDRKKDLIIASGYNIVPREVEEVLFTHPSVQEAVVAGVPDEKRGETVKAYIVLKKGMTGDAEEIRAFCKENLAPYKVPRLVEFRKELPKSQVGKVLRRVLVEEEEAKQQESSQATSATSTSDAE